MHRRAARAIVAVLVALVALAVPPSFAEPASAGSDDVPPVTVNDFLPEDRNLGDCVGALERPGCGSEERGGWRQTLVFVAVAVGLAVVFGRVAWAARHRRRSAP